MTELEQLKQQLEEISKKIAELEKPKKEIWKPVVGEGYYFVSVLSDVCFETVDESSFDLNMFEFGNFFKTEEEAEYQAKVQKYTNLFRKYVEEHSGPLDWNNMNQCKCYAYYSTYHECIDFNTENHRKLQGVIYASERQILEDAISFVGEENVIKYVLGVSV